MEGDSGAGDSAAGDTDEGLEEMAADSTSEEDADFSMDQGVAAGEASLSAGAISISEWEACKEFKHHGVSEQ